MAVYKKLLKNRKGDTIIPVTDLDATYSTAEVDTGKLWIDGKKIYRRCFSGTYSVTGGSVFDTAIMNGVVETIISWGGSMEYGGGINAIPFGEGSGNYCILFKRDSSGDVILRRYSSDTRTNCKYSLWVEYTKPS